MALWEFTEYDSETLGQIIYHCEALKELGIEQDEDMMAELHIEQTKREEQEEQEGEEEREETY